MGQYKRLILNSAPGTVGIIHILALFFWLLYKSICLNLGNTVKLTESGNIKSLKESECHYHHKVIKKQLIPLNAQGFTDSVASCFIHLTGHRTVLFLRLNSLSKEDRCQVSLHSMDSHQTHPHPHPSFHKGGLKEPQGSSEWYSTCPCVGHYGFSSSFPRGRGGITTHPKPSEGASKTIVQMLGNLLKGKTGTPLPVNICLCGIVPVWVGKRMQREAARPHPFTIHSSGKYFSGTTMCQVLVQVLEAQQ